MLKWYFLFRLFVCLFIYFLEGLGGGGGDFDGELRRGMHMCNVNSFGMLKRQRTHLAKAYFQNSLNVIEMSFRMTYNPAPFLKSINILGILFTNIIGGLVHVLLLLVLFGYYFFISYSLFYNLVQVII